MKEIDRQWIYCALLSMQLSGRNGSLSSISCCLSM
jgi:hypothetical protein